MLNLNEIEDKAIPTFIFKNTGTIAQVITDLMPWIFGIAGILLLLYLLYGGIHLMLAAGDPKQVAEAKGKITGALVGFAIVFVAFWLVQIFGSVLGLKGINTIFGG